MFRRLPSPGLRLLAVLSCLSSAANAQTSYCTPSNTQGQCYFFSTLFDQPVNNRIVNPRQFQFNPNSSYTDNTGVGSSGTLAPYHTTAIQYGVYNPSGTITYSTTVKSWIDWNGDFDFNDANEDQYTISMTMTPYLSYNAFMYLSVPVNTPPGNYRMRMAVAHGAAPTPCGSFSGETEDYIITVAANTAPVLATTETPFVNPLDVTQTNTNGFGISRIYLNSNQQPRITDADNISGSLVPKGIAITGQSATNGTWQYRIGTGSWTAFGAVSATNALLLSGDGLVPSDPVNTVGIRFVPSGPGTATFTYRAWDLSSGTAGTYTNIATSGGTTAFSMASQTVSLPIYDMSASGMLPVYFIGNDSVMQRTPYDRSNARIVQPQRLPVSAPGQRGSEICTDMTTGSLWWSAGNEIITAAPDGSALDTVLTTPSIYGLAVGGGSVFYGAYGSQQDLYRCDQSGSNCVSLFNGAGQLQSAEIGYTDRAYYFKNRLYQIIVDADYVNTYLVGMDVDGLNADTVHMFTGFPNSLHIVSDTAYWTEYDGTSTYHLMAKAINGQGTATSLLSTSNYNLGMALADPANRRALVLNGNQVLQLDWSTGTTSRALHLEHYPMGMTAAIPSTAVSLPLELVSWSAVPAGQNARLNWTISEPAPGMRFTVERSLDGRNFEPLHSLAGDDRKLYEAFDEAPADGANYYRLAMTGRSGKTAYSDTKLLRFGKAAAITVFPNPATNTLYLDGIEAGSVVRVLTPAGQQLGMYPASGSRTGIDVSKLPAGLYQLEIGSPSGMRAYSRFVKK